MAFQAVGRITIIPRLTEALQGSWIVLTVCWAWLAASIQQVQPWNTHALSSIPGCFLRALGYGHDYILDANSIVEGEVSVADAGSLDELWVERTWADSTEAREGVNANTGDSVVELVGSAEHAGVVVHFVVVDALADTTVPDGVVGALRAAATDVVVAIAADA